MKRIIEFVREHWLRMGVTCALLFLAVWWGIDDLGFIPGAIGVILWTR